jgi:hypothetical protein
VPPPDLTLNPVEVRASIDLTYGEETIPNVIINLQSFGGEAERWVKSRAVNINDMTADQGAALLLAKTKKTAELLVPQIPNLISERGETGESYTREPLNIPETVARLSAEAERYLAIANGVNLTVVSGGAPRVFGLAHGSRGK